MPLTGQLGRGVTRLFSKNHSPCRISSSTVGRIERTSSDSHRIVASSAIAPAMSLRRVADRYGASSSFSSSARCSWLCRNVRRAASVGCAVSTSSRWTSSRAARRISVSDTPPSRRCATASAMLSGSGVPSSRCRRRRRRCTCSARFARCSSWPSARTSSVRSSSASPSMADRVRPTAATVPARRAAAASATARSTIDVTWPPASSAIAVRSAPASRVTSRSSSS